MRRWWTPITNVKEDSDSLKKCDFEDDEDGIIRDGIRETVAAKRNRDELNNKKKRDLKVVEEDNNENVSKLDDSKDKVD